jgi:hypothetical protein
LVELFTDNGSEEESKNGELALKLAESGVNPQYVVIDANETRIAKTDYNTARHADQMEAWLKANAQ